MESYHYVNYIFVHKHYMHDTCRYIHTITNNSVSVKAKKSNSTWNYSYGKVTQVKCECIHLVLRRSSASQV